MTTLRPVARAMRASARGSRPIVLGVGSTTVRPPARLNRRISSSATRSSRRRRLSRFALKFWRTQPRFSRLTGSHARPLSPAAAGSANITLKSIRRCSCGRAIPIASGATAPSTVWTWPASGLAILPECRRDLRDEPVEVAAQLGQRPEHARDEQRVDPGRPELMKLLADLIRRARQAGVTRVGGVPAHALGDRLGELVALALAVGDQQGHVRGALEALGIAAQRGAVLVEDLAFAPEDPGPAPAVPVVGVLGDDLEGDTLAAPADHQLGVGGLDRFGIEGGVGELVVAPLERRAPFLPQRADHLAGLVQPLESLAHRVEGNAVRLVLVLLPARAQSEEEPPAGDDIDLRGHLGDDRRMAIGITENDRAYAESRHQSCQSAQGAPRLEHRALALLRVRHEVIGHAGDVPPSRLEMLPEVHHAFPGLAAHAGEDAEAHVSISSFGPQY